MRKIYVLVMTLAFCLLFSPFSHAHKVMVFAWVEDGVIHTESGFGGQKKAQNCPVTIKDSAGNILAQGKTDIAGLWNVPVPQGMQSDLLVELDAGTAHAAQWTIALSELYSKDGDTQVARAMTEKAALEKSPSMSKILLGIAIIFALAYGFKMVKKRLVLK